MSLRTIDAAIPSSLRANSFPIEFCVQIDESLWRGKKMACTSEKKCGSGYSNSRLLLIAFISELNLIASD
jgi:hypothetical protein